MTTSSRQTSSLLLVLGIGIAITAFNMRATIVAVGPLLETIRRDTGLSTTIAGLLTTLPVVCFGALSGVAPRLARRFGIDLMIWLTMVGLTAGIAIRLATPITFLFLGTAVIGASLALANVLVPAVIKRDFPERTGMMTGVYGVGLAAGSALASAVMVPIYESTGLGWRGTLGVLGIPAMLAVVALVPRLLINRERRAHAKARAMAVPRLWGNRLAWQVSIFMGMQSFIYFGLGSWMSSFLIDNGIPDARAGFLWSLCNLSGLPFSFGVPVLAQKFRDQRPLVVAMVAIWAISIIGLLIEPKDLAVLWMVLFGIGGGTALSLALMFIVLRSPDAGHASSLSGMAQAIGYTLASFAPFLFGALHDLTGAWQASVVMILLSLAPTMWAGWFAAQRRLVAPLPEPAVVHTAT